jgi:hypothetical protein
MINILLIIALVCGLLFWLLSEVLGFNRYLRFCLGTSVVILSCIIFFNAYKNEQFDIRKQCYRQVLINVANATTAEEQQHIFELLNVYTNDNDVLKLCTSLESKNNNH